FLAVIRVPRRGRPDADDDTAATADARHQRAAGRSRDRPDDDRVVSLADVLGAHPHAAAQGNSLAIRIRTRTHSMGLFDIFSGDDMRDAAAAKEAAIRQGYSDLASLFGQGRDALTANSGIAAGYYQPVYDTALRGYDAYADALGLNGADGIARARAMYQ